MSEIEREELLAQRQEEMQRIQDKRNLDQMLRDRTGAGDETVSKAAKRTYTATEAGLVDSHRVVGQHAQRGHTKEKSRKLDELKAKRKAKDEKKRVSDSSADKELLNGTCREDEGRFTQARPVVITHGHGDVGRRRGRRPNQQI